MAIKMIELFSGIGAQAQAMTDLGLEYETICCEVDEKAHKSYCAIHGDTPNLGDITKIEHLPECDLLTYSFPCTDISMAGKREGFKEGSGTRSSLLWEVKRLLIDMKEREKDGCRLPQTLLMENVKALIFKKNLPDFNKWIEFLDSLGYTSVWKVLNAKDYGVPQNRERVFLVSRLDGKKFVFPEPCPDNRVLRDVLEDNVPEEYYLSDDKIAKYEAHRVRQEENGRGFGWRPSDGSEVAHGITTNYTRHGSNFIKENRTGMILDGRLDKKFVSDTYVYSKDGMAPTLLGLRSNCNARIRDDSSENTNGQIKAGSLNLSNFGQANTVHSVDGVAPTITTCHIGIGQPKIEVAGEMSDTKVIQAKNVYSDNGVSPSVIGNGGSGSKIKIEVAGDLKIDSWHRLANEVLSPDGIATTVHAQSNNLKKKVEVSNEHTESIKIKGKAMKKEQELKDGDALAYKFINTAQSPVNKGFSPTLTREVGGGVAVGVVDDKSPKIEIAGNLHREEYQDRMNRVYGTDGLAPTMICTSGGGMQPKIEVPNDCICEKIVERVAVRTHEIDMNELYDFLIRYKKSSNKTIKDISSELNVPKTKVEHWFRNDEFQSIPAPDVWDGLKEILCITDNSFDERICDFTIKDGVFESNQRCYSEQGISPTVTTGSKTTKISTQKIQVIGDLNIPGESETNNRVHSPDGLSPTVRASHRPIMKDSEEIPDLKDGECASMLTPGRVKKRQNGPRYKKDGTTFTVTCQDMHGVIKNDNGKLRIRYLTPRECWRLQGFSDDAFDKAKAAGMSKSSLYKQAGNSIAVTCLKAIFKGIYIDKTFESKPKGVDGY